MNKNILKQLKNSRIEQVLEYWVNYYKQKELDLSGDKVADLGHSAQELGFENELGYEYSVKINFVNKKHKEFKYFAKFNSKNELI